MQPPVLLVPTGILEPLNRWLNLQAAADCLFAGVCVKKEVMVGLISVYCNEYESMFLILCLYKEVTL